MSSSTSARSEVEGILETLDNSQDGIKAFTRAALSSDPSQVVQAWRGELSRRLVIAQDPLPLVYACNDVLQESKGAKHEEYRQKFAEILGEDFKAVLEEKPALRKQVDKVISIWAARHVFEKSFLRKLRATVFQEDDVESSDSRDGSRSGDRDDEQKGDSNDLVSSQKVVDPFELQRNALNALSAAKLIALGEWVKNEIKSSSSISPAKFEGASKKARRALDSSQDTQALHEASVELKQVLEEMKARRRCLQASAPVHDATKVALENLARRVEESMQRGMEDTNQCDLVGDVLESLLSATPGSDTLETRYKSIHLMPKREKVKVQIAQGPELSNQKERLLREGLTAEAAAQSERPLVYHKGLQKWIPLPSGEDSDNWRD